MSKVEDILTLAKAGFNARQIAVLLSEPAEPAANAVPSVPSVPAARAVPAAPAVPAVPAVPAAPAAPAVPAEPDMGGKLDAILQLMQSSNLMQAHQPEPETAETIIASIINPKGA